MESTQMSRSFEKYLPPLIDDSDLDVFLEEHKVGAKLRRVINEPISPFSDVDSVEHAILEEGEVGAEMRRWTEEDSARMARSSEKSPFTDIESDKFAPEAEMESAKKIDEYEPRGGDDKTKAILQAFLKLLPRDGKHNFCTVVTKTPDLYTLAEHLNIAVLSPSPFFLSYLYDIYFSYIFCPNTLANILI